MRSSMAQPARKTWSFFDPLSVAGAGVQGMRADVLARKINTRANDANASTPGYIEPATLTDAEMQIVCDLTAPLREQLYR